MGQPRTLRAKSDCVKQVEINAPAPGTPLDSLYPLPTAPCQETGYHYEVETDNYPLPLTVYRPYIQPVAPVRIRAGELCRIRLSVRNPASDVSEEATGTRLYNGQILLPHYSVKGVASPLQITCENLPEGAQLNPDDTEFLWTPTGSQKGEHYIVFAVDDGLMPEKMRIKITVEDTEND